jgi:hypothetical protein
MIAVVGMPGPSSVIQGCAEPVAGGLRVIDGGAACRASERALSWNRPGRDGPPGAVGSRGAAGSPGPAGLSGVPGTAVHALGYDALWLPMPLTSVLHAELPPGSWVVNGTVLVNNLGIERQGVFCALDGGARPLVFSGVQLEPEGPQTEWRFSGTTLPVSLAATLAGPGRVDLLCGGAGPWVEVYVRQLNAVPVDGVAVQ